MNNCPKCGAEKSDEEFYTCGTLVNETDFDRGCACYEAELCHLRERVAWLERWREVVLSKTEATLGGVYSLMTVSVSGASSARDIYDAAVRKEMEGK